MKQADPYIALIKQAVERVSSYTPPTKQDFVNSPIIQDAILMRLQEIGENLIKIRDKTPDYYEQHAQENWSKMIGLRNIISHGYHTLDAEQIWDIVVNYFPDFAKYINSL